MANAQAKRAVIDQDPEGIHLPRADILSVPDALLTVPSGYVDARELHSTVQVVLDALAKRQPMVIAAFTVSGIVGYDEANKPLAPELNFKFNTKKKRMFAHRLEVLCRDEIGTNFSVSVFGGVSAWKKIQPGLYPMVVTGARRFGKSLFLEATIADGRMLEIIGHVAPLYAGIPGAVKAERMTECVDAAVGMAMDNPDFWLQARDKVLAEAHCGEKELLDVSNTSASNLAVVLRALHRPQSYQEAQLAKTAVMQIAAAAVRSRSQHFFKSRPDDPACAITGIRSSVSSVIAELQANQGIKLTDNQVECINALSLAMEEPTPSAHMLNGDVGSGKTLTFLIPAIAAFRRGKNVAVMAPTGILADQLARQMVDRFPSVPMVRLEAGDKMPAERALLISTPGLTSICKKASWVPDVLIVDEQHKMPAATRECLVGPRTHVVEATATPIPRSMAIAMYAGLTQLVLSEMPFKNTRITKAIYGPEGRKDMSLTVSRALRDGAKVAFVYPAVALAQEPKEGDLPESIEEQEQQSAKLKASVLEAFNRLNATWPGKVARLYSDMNESEQRAEIEALRSGSKNALVASSLIEVGIDIPQLDVMVVNGADRFGLAQLHQLRGRTARGGGTGHFLMYMEKSESEYDAYTTERMRAMEEISDGFRLAEVDLKQRGFGDTAGDQQSGRGNLIFRGINLSPADFLKLSIPETSQHAKAVALAALPPLPQPSPYDEPEPALCAGQLPLI